MLSQSHASYVALVTFYTEYVIMNLKFLNWSTMFVIHFIMHWFWLTNLFLDV